MASKNLTHIFMIMRDKAIQRRNMYKQVEFPYPILSLKELHPISPHMAFVAVLFGAPKHHLPIEFWTTSSFLMFSAL
ncbi:hypothetical protein E2C01_060220 [Portunus trituberculatus]|uniref:Uncharacterized protein n=1 Tax=Portunus trituberculatus TaxID=210409 RepID=A0A5B7H9V5_PORTR|nr:hypothetical protein [Portunus trituberculatus]